MLIHLLTHCRILIMCHRRCRMESFMGILVKKWGNSAAIRIPSGLMVAAALDIGQEVEVREEGGRLIIEPVLKPAYTLDELLASMTQETRSEERSVGKEGVSTCGSRW